MANVNVNTLLPQVSPFVERCPANLQLWALRKASRRFLMDTHVLEETLADIASVEDQKEYTLTSEYTNMNFNRVVTVYLHQDGAAYNKTGELAADKWSFDGNVTLTLDPAPVEDDLDIQVTVVYEPQMDCVLYPDYIFNRWGETVAWGAIEALRRDPINTKDPVPWFDVGAANLALEKYKEGVNEVKELMLSKNQSGRINAVEMRVF